MSTKLQPSKSELKSPQSTYQVRELLYDSWKAMTGAIAFMDPFSPTTAWASSSNLSRPAVVRKSPKAAEADRQIERIRSLLVLYDEHGEHRAKLSESIGTSISLLNSFVTLPLPIPVASDGEDDGTSLFINTDELYGDLEISGNTIEYYLRSKLGGQETEIYDIEEAEEGRIPPRLLGRLYTHHAI